jgi:putative hydrolase of the HAD superfamily
MGDPAPHECLFVDDTDVNCDTARDLGISAVHYRENDQAIGEMRAVLGL